MADQNVYEAHRSLVPRYGRIDGYGKTTLLVKVMNFNFGDIDVMESKFEESNLLIKGHDENSGLDNVSDTIKRAILVARAPEPLRTHLELSSQSHSTFLEQRQAINQHLKARKGFKLKEREDDPVDVDFVHKESIKGKGEGNDKGKGKPKGKGKQKRQTQRVRKECRKKQVESRNVPRTQKQLWQDGTQMERMLGEKRRTRETSEQRRRDGENW